MLQGWLCPRCNKILAPHITQCDCFQHLQLVPQMTQPMTYQPKQTSAPFYPTMNLPNLSYPYYKPFDTHS